MPLSCLTRLPSSQSTVIGTATFRGPALKVIDMAAAIGYAPLMAEDRAPASVIVTDVNRKKSALWCAKWRIVETDRKGVSLPPKALGKNAFITGLGRLTHFFEITVS